MRGMRLSETAALLFLPPDQGTHPSVCTARRAET